MPTYRTPGVYVEEFEIGAKPIEGVSTSTAAFLGEAERGPTTPTKITSWPDYQRRFGQFYDPAAYLPYAVEGFFRNGGQEVYVTRIVGAASTTSNLTIGGWRFVAAGPGTWGNRVQVQVAEGETKDAAGNALGVNLFVRYWRAGQNPANDDPDLEEVYADIAIADERSPNYIAKRLQEGVSALIEVERAVAQPNTLPITPRTPLATGQDAAPVDTDYSGAVTNFPGGIARDARTGLLALEEPRFQDVAILHAPAASNSIAGLVVDHCDNMRYRFAVLDGPANDPNYQNPRVIRDSLRGALYYPWIRIIDPVSNALKYVPPGGYVAGIYARSDTERGVWKAPANETVRGAAQVRFEFTDAQQAGLNPMGVNVIRSFYNRGIRVWGSRTLSSDPLWKYVNVRRLFIFLEASIYRATQWVVFEPNSERLWARVRQTIEQFLRTQWRAGALMGLREEEAFFVRADRSTMTQDDIDNGRLIVEIGVSPVKPAEFVIFRIAQFTAGDQS